MAQSDNKEQRQVRINKAYDLRLKGYSYREIGSALGVSHVTAQTWITEYLSATTLPLVDEVRKQEVDRLQRYLKALEDRVEEGDDKAISLALKVSERLCKMLGIDMPTQVEVHKTETSQQDLAIMDLIASQKARSELRKAEATSRRPIDDGGSETFTESDVLSSDIESIVLEN